VSRVTKTTLQKDRETMKANLVDVPTELLEAEIVRRSASARQMEDLLTFLREGPDGYNSYGDPVLFDVETFINLLKRDWHMCLLSSAVEFDDIEKWIRRIVFGKDDGRRETK
jgi:hypothetical protein